MRGRGRQRRKEVAELNITAFMNLMVILIPFLLITVVFSKLTILEMNLPAPSAEPPENPDQDIEIIVRKDSLEVGTSRAGSYNRIKVFPKVGDAYPIKELSAMLVKVKERRPEKVTATMSLEPDIPYDDLIRVMDAVRTSEVDRNGVMVQAELFPEVALGDAPEIAGQ